MSSSASRRSTWHRRSENANSTGTEEFTSPPTTPHRLRHSLNGDSLNGRGSFFDAESQISMYQSALDLDTLPIAEPTDHEEIILEKLNDGASCAACPPESTEEVPGNQTLPNDKTGNTDLHFRDGVRRIDFVLAYRNSTSMEAIGHSASRQIFEDNLKEEGLRLEHEPTGGEVRPDEGVKFVKIHAPWEVLTRYAEIMQLKMPMKELETLSSLTQVLNFGQRLRCKSHLDERSIVKDDVTYAKRKRTTKASLGEEMKSLSDRLAAMFNLDTKMFRAQDKRVTYIYTRDKEYLFDIPPNREDFFSAANRSQIVEFILQRKSFTDNDADYASGITRLLADGVYIAAYPLHEGRHNQPAPDNMRGLLYSEWAILSKSHKLQPIDHIKDYFGVTIGLYFAWLGFYTYMLIPASIVGLICFIYGWVSLNSDIPRNDICGNTVPVIMCPPCDRCNYWNLTESCTQSRVTYLVDNPSTVAFAVFMSFWGAVFLEMWKRYAATITCRWDLTGFDQSKEQPRPEYVAKLSIVRKVQVGDVITTGEPSVSFWKQKFPAFLMSISVILLLVSVAIAAVIGVILYRMSVGAALVIYYESREGDLISRHAPLITTATAAMINLAFIGLLNMVYGRVAVFLTEIELHRTQSDFDNSLTLKLFLLQFVNFYASIMYIALLKGKLVGHPSNYNRFFGFRQEECNPGGCLMELTVQLGIIMVGKQAWNAVVEMIIPKLCRWWATKRKYFSKTPDEIRKSWECDLRLADLGSQGLFWEYLEMVLQFGFVTLFVAAFPLAPFFALINNCMEMRLDAKKFVVYYRRPVSRRVKDIGIWYRILDCIGKFSVVTNAFIIAFTSSFIPRLVYQYQVSEDQSLTGYLNHSLSYFDVNDFPSNYRPVHNIPGNETYCRYDSYRQPPWSVNKYQYTEYYWIVLAARLSFVVVFENVVMLVVTILRWMVPDVPKSVNLQLRRDLFLTNEVIVQNELIRAKVEAAKNSSHASRPPSVPITNSGITPNRHSWTATSATDNAQSRLRRPESVV